jgi:inosine triphosphate pyrophosphatase
VAVAKAKEAGKAVTDGSLVLVEDTSLCFDALGGLPGVYVKHFLDKTGRTGLVKLLDAFPDKAATAQCIFALALAGGEVRTFVGQTRGLVVPPRGPSDAFGWDPIFQPSEGAGGRTFAEMSKDEKNAVSHRGKALGKVIEFLDGLSSAKGVVVEAVGVEAANASSSISPPKRSKDSSAKEG